MIWHKYTSRTQGKDVKLDDLVSKLIVNKIGSSLDNLVYPMFSTAQNSPFSKLLERLVRHSASDPVSAFIWDQLFERDRERLSHYSRPNLTSKQRKLAHSIIVQCLNKTIEGQCIYELERFRDIPWPAKTAALIEHNLTASSAHQNRLLLEHVYERELQRIRNFSSHGAKGEERTILIKVALCELGHQIPDADRHFKVYANRLPPNMLQINGGEYISREWLYDLHWYTETDDVQLDDIKDLTQFIKRLTAHSASDQLSAFLWGQLSDGDRNKLTNYHQAATTTSPGVRRIVVRLLDKVIKQSTIYKLHRKRPKRSRTASRLKCLNRLRLQEAYPLELSLIHDYQPTSLPLVVECQWRPKRNEDSLVPFSGCKFHFQKLLIANAELRLMIFLKREGEDISQLDDYFVAAIDNYNNIAEGSKFLFIAFEEGKEGIEGFSYAFIKAVKQKQGVNCQLCP